MPREHIHVYDTRYHAVAKYSKVIHASGDFVFMQGQVGTLLDGTLIGEGDPGAQAHQACRNIKHWMEEAGGSLQDACIGRDTPRAPCPAPTPLTGAVKGQPTIATHL